MNKELEDLAVTILGKISSSKKRKSYAVNGLSTQPSLGRGALPKNIGYVKITSH